LEPPSASPDAIIALKGFDKDSSVYGVVGDLPGDAGDVEEMAAAPCQFYFAVPGLK
jgi:hypothetical protein